MHIPASIIYKKYLSLAPNCCLTLITLVIARSFAKDVFGKAVAMAGTLFSASLNIDQKTPCFLWPWRNTFFGVGWRSFDQLSYLLH